MPASSCLPAPLGAVLGLCSPAGPFPKLLPDVLGRFAERRSPGQALLAQEALLVLGRVRLARKFKLRLSPGSHQSCEFGVFSCVPPLPLAEQCWHRHGAVLGSLELLQPLLDPAQALLERNIFPLLAQELGRVLGSSLLLSSVCPTRNEFC